MLASCHMEHKMQFNFSLCVILLVLRCCNSKRPSMSCVDGVGKDPGSLMLQSNTINLDVTPLTEFSSLSTINCTITCTYNSRCWTAAFIERRSVCRLYGKSAPFENKNIDGVLTYRWMPCSEISSCSKQDFRCRGFWLQRPWLSIKGSRVLNITFEPKRHECLSKCTENAVCAAVNYIHRIQSCEHLEFENHYTVSEHFNSNVSSYQWHCCARNDGDLPKKCKSLPGKCEGFWKVDNDEPTDPRRITEAFFTTGRDNCLDSCERNPYCSRAYVNQSVGYCLLMSDIDPGDDLSCSNDQRYLRKGLSWHGYSWHCCSSSASPIKPEDPNTPSPYGRCACFGKNSTKSVLIAKDGCFEPVLDATVEMDSSLIAFWQPADVQVHVNDQTWMRFFNGEVFLWVLVVGRLTYCETQYCHQYSTVMPSSYSCPAIASRSTWHARPPKNGTLPYAGIPGLAIITNTVCPYFGCHSVLSCGSYLRRLQINSAVPSQTDIPYNYLISDSGEVCEGRGMKYIGAHTLEYNSGSVGIAFIGWFKKRRPSVKSIIAVRRLIWCLQQRRNLTNDYILYGFRDLRPFTEPGYFLYQILQNWGHYSKKRIPAGLNCADIQKAKLIRNLFMASGFACLCLLAAIASVLYAKVFTHHIWCPRRCRRYKSKIFTSIGRQNAFPALLDSLNASCITCHPAGLQAREDNMSLILAIDKNTTCQCESLFCLIWSRSVLVGHSYHFPSVLSRALKFQSCHHFTVIIRADPLYIVHSANFNIIQTAARTIVEDDCLCKLKLLSMRSASLPALDRSFVWSADEMLFSQDQRDLLLTSVSLDQFCRLPDEKDADLLTDVAENRSDSTENLLS